MTYGGSQTKTSFPSFVGAKVPIPFTDFVEAGHNATFPRIVVIGDENSGKSSLLQRVAGQNVFPVSERFCTRMPVVLSLKSVTPELDNGAIDIIKLRALHNDKVLDDRTIKIDDIGCIADKVKLAIDTLNNSVNTQRGAPFDDRSVLTDHSIEITMFRPDFPDIDFIDLPGLVTDAGAREATAKLTESYLKDENAILLWVVSDFSDSLRVNITLGLLQSAAHNNPAIQDRVVVALTKSDKSINDENAGGRRIKERMADLKTTFGFTPAAVVPVISRPDLPDAIIAAQSEEQLFDAMNVPAPRGLNGFLSKVAEIAEKHFKTVWAPSVTKKMNAEMEDLREVINGFGFEPAYLSPSAVCGSLAKMIWEAKDMTSEFFEPDIDSMWSQAWPGTCPFDASILKRKLSDLKPCERACINSLWDSHLSTFHKTAAESYPYILNTIIKKSIDDFDGSDRSIPLSSSQLKRIDFAFITEIEPSFPTYDASQKYAYQNIVLSCSSAPPLASSCGVHYIDVDTAFKKHLSDCFHSWIVFPLLQTIDRMCEEMPEETPVFKETVEAAAERYIANYKLNMKHNVVKRLSAWCTDGQEVWSDCTEPTDP